jgi:hypothetical protein
MADYSDHQKKVIGRYYDRRGEIMLTKLQELVTELYLAEEGLQRERLWERVRRAMTNLKIPPALIDHILSQRDPAILARNVQDWLKEAGIRQSGR